MTPQSELAALAAAPRAGRPAPLVLVTGGKGGVGKTVLTANLGVQLALAGLRPLLVDLDLGLANLDVLLRLDRGPTVEDARAGACALADCVAPGPAGVHVLRASSGNVAMGRPDAQRRAWLASGVAELARAYDVVLADSPAGIGPDVLAAAAAADHVLCVTTPDPSALTDAYGLIKALDQHALEAGREVPTPELVVNLVAGAEEALEVAARLRNACERFLARSPRSAGWLPRSAAVAESALRRSPFALADPRGLAAGCVRRLAQRVARLCATARAPLPG